MLSEKELHMLNTEGIEVRLRNKLSPILSLIPLFERYCRVVPSHGELIRVIVKLDISSRESLAVMKEIARYQRNDQLLNKLGEFDALFVLIQKFRKSTGAVSKMYARKISAERKKYETLIHDILLSVQKESN